MRNIEKSLRGRIKSRQRRFEVRKLKMEYRKIYGGEMWNDDGQLRI